MNKLSSNIKKIALSLLVVGLAVGFSAFKSVESRALEQWHFKAGEPLSNADVPGSYELVTSPPQSCNNLPGKPCIVRFNNSDPSTPDLAAYLATFSGVDADIAAAAFAKRNN